MALLNKRHQPEEVKMSTKSIKISIMIMIFVMILALGGSASAEPNSTAYVTIVKKAVAPSLQAFSFRLTRYSTTYDFTLTDNSSTTDASVTYDVYVSSSGSSTWTLSERNIPSGWNLVDLTCTDPATTIDLATATATLSLSRNETVTCTFTNYDTPTAVEVSAPSVEAGDGFAKLSWDTVSLEVNLSGFNVYRSESNDYAQADMVTSQMISSKYQGDKGQYEYLDTGLLAGHTYYYWVEAVYGDGSPLVQAAEPTLIWWYLKVPIAFR
jgi:hypothetical protein